MWPQDDQPSVPLLWVRLGPTTSHPCTLVSYFSNGDIDIWYPFFIPVSLIATLHSGVTPENSCKAVCFNTVAFWHCSSARGLKVNCIYLMRQITNKLTQYIIRTLGWFQVEAYRLVLFMASGNSWEQNLLSLYICFKSCKIISLCRGCPVPCTIL